MGVLFLGIKSGLLRYYFVYPILDLHEEVSLMKVTIAAENKYYLTVEEAAAYFNVGIKRLISLLESPEGAELMLMVGVKKLVKRKKMEKYLDQVYSI